LQSVCKYSWHAVVSGGASFPKSMNKTIPRPPENIKQLAVIDGLV